MFGKGMAQRCEESQRQGEAGPGSAPNSFSEEEHRTASNRNGIAQDVLQRHSNLTRS